MGGIVDDAQSMFRGHGSDAVVVAQQAVVVHRDDRLCPWTDQALGLVKVDAERVVVDVAEDRFSADGQDSLEVGDVVERRRDDLVAGSNTGDVHGQMQGRVSRADGDDVPILGLDKRLDGALEIADVAAHAEPAQLERSSNGLKLLLLQQRFEDGNGRHCWTPQEEGAKAVGRAMAQFG